MAKSKKERKRIHHRIRRAARKIKDNTANPAPLGLMAFGMTTVLLNLHNAGLFSRGSMILAMGLFFGGLAQVIAGIMEWKKGNTFGMTAFISYGFFWLSYVFLVIGPIFGLGSPPELIAMAAYLALWGVFTAGMFIGTLKLGKALRFVFGSLTLLFFLLAIADITGIVVIKQAAGYGGIICGASAMYTSLAIVLNDVYGKKIAPV